MNIEQLYRDYNITFVTEGHKHSRPGWVNIECPFCSGNPGYHLGFDEQKEYYVCWRCGGHSIPKVISTILKIHYSEVKTILRQYQGGYLLKEKETSTIQTTPFAFPSNMTEELPPQHIKYLLKRKFDIELLQREWEIKATGLFSKLLYLDNNKEPVEINFKQRLIIPIYWNGEIVTFQGRDITDKHPKKYMACPSNMEKVNIKTILYGKQSKWTDLGICVEGVTDVWRLGEKAVGVFGIKYKAAQIRLLAKIFKRVPVLFDDDSQAVEQANKLVADLRFRGVESWRIPIIGDPGSMSQEDANALVRELTTWKIK